MKEFLNSGIEIGNFEITIVGLMQFAAVLAAAQISIWTLRGVLRKFARGSNMEEGTRFMVMRMIRTFIYLVAFLVALETAGIDLTVFWAGSAALLVGVGIGLQNFFNDVISGFVLLFEGGVRVGDELEVDGMMVRVERIDLRSTRVITRYGNLIVLPNGLISGQSVRNFTQGDVATLLQVDVGVAYGSDVQKVRDILVEVANSEELVVRKSETAALFNDFGDSALVFTVYFWIEEPWRRKVIASNVRFRIDEEFRKHGVKIPFPQRDLHLYAENLEQAGIKSARLGQTDGPEV